MQEILEYSHVILFFVFEWVLCFFVLYCYGLYNKTTIKVRTLIMTSNIGAILITTSYLLIDESAVFLSALLLFLILVLVFKLTYDYTCYQILYTASIFVSIYYIMYILIYYFINYQLQVLYINDFMLHELSLFAMQICLLGIYSIKENIFSISAQKEGKLVTIFSVLMMLVIPGLLSLLPDLTTWNFMFFLTLLFTGLLCFIGNIIIYYLLMVSKQLFVERQNALSLQIEDVYKLKINEENQVLHKIRHDLKNNVIVIQKLLEMDKKEEALKHIQTITKIVNKNDVRIYTNLVLLDAYINYIIEQNKDLYFDISSNDLSNVSIHHNDLLLLIMNLVDNAIENIDNEKRIQVSFLFENNQLLLNISNSTYKDPALTLYKTTKQHKKMHGYGLQIINDIVNRYNANYLHGYSDGYYQVYIVFTFKEGEYEL